MGKIINVLIVEDSPVSQQLLAHILSSDPALRVQGMVGSAEDAMEFLQQHKPDIIVMDIFLEGMDGFAATRKIMETHPVPIIVCSGVLSTREVTATFQALEAGALAFVAKPAGPGNPGYEEAAGTLVQTVKLMSEVKVIKRWPRERMTAKSNSGHDTSSVKKPSTTAIQGVVIGTSTGGPPVLQTILARLPRNFPYPVLIVQHIAPGFLLGLSDWLNASSALPVHIAAHGEPVFPGRVYLAPDGYHMGVNASGRIVLSKPAQEENLRPSVAHLFRSAAETWGGNTVAVLLTGMGADGARELKQLKDLGALTIAQDQESSVVHGMPGEAIKLDAAAHILAPEKIAALLAGLTPSTYEHRTQN